MDNATRWNSVYRMLTRALNVKERLTKFSREHTPDPSASYSPYEDRLLKADWSYIAKLKKALETYDAATMVNQGHDAWLSDWFPSLHLAMNKIDSWKNQARELDGDERLAAAFTSSWNKIEKYYKLVDQTPIYYAAIVLNPALKLQKLRQLWYTNETKTWIEPCRQQVKDIYEKQYKQQYSRYRDEYHPPGPDDDDEEDSIYSLFSSNKRLCVDTTSERPDPFEAYLLVEPIAHRNGERFDPIAWWQINGHAYPGLKQMALDIFSIPLMTDDNERSFSSGRDMITYRRTRLLRRG